MQQPYGPVEPPGLQGDPGGPVEPPGLQGDPALVSGRGKGGLRGV